MKKKRIMIVIAVLSVIVLVSLMTTKAQYRNKQKGQAELSIASPKIRIINEKTQLEELNFDTYSNDFKIVNYDENNHITEVPLDYSLSFDITDADAPIDMKLYKVELDGTETEVELNKNLETDFQFSMKSGKKEENDFRLKMWFNFENRKMDENVEVNVNLMSMQAK